MKYSYVGSESEKNRRTTAIDCGIKQMFPAFIIFSARG